MKHHGPNTGTARFLWVLEIILLCTGMAIGPPLGRADPHSGQSLNVVIIGGSTLGTRCYRMYPTNANQMWWTDGGCLPVTGAVGELGDFTFTPMLPGQVSAESLAPYDTAVLNVASDAIRCDTSALTAQQKAELIAFVERGKKLIIYDSECSGPVDYSWLPYPFTTVNPGAEGATGTLFVVEDNLLSTLVGDPSCLSGDLHCINVAYLGASVDAVGDMNLMTTRDPRWCVDLAGINCLGMEGPSHVYATYPPGTDRGLIIYNGLDQDPQARRRVEDPNLRKLWVQELQQPFNPSNLPCAVAVVGITLAPESATNTEGDSHMVTASLTNLIGEPQAAIPVSFSVTTGPNAGTTGTCSANADCTTDADGLVSFTYVGDGGVGQDEINACFVNRFDETVCSATVVKDWVAIVQPPPEIDLQPPEAINDVNTGHAVTATVSVPGDPPVPVPSLLVTFTVITGPNAGASGTCSLNADCTTDANGQVTFTYVGMLDGVDEIEACFTDDQQNEICQVVTKTWTALPPEKPDCTKASAVPPRIWPPNGKMAPITIVGVTPADAVVTPTAIYQDEPVCSICQARGTAPDGWLSPLAVRAERDGWLWAPGNGRVYHIHFTAQYGSESCEGVVKVCVPHAYCSHCVDNGELYNSLVRPWWCRLARCHTCRPTCDDQH